MYGGLGEANLVGDFLILGAVILLIGVYLARRG